MYGGLQISSEGFVSCKVESVEADQRSVHSNRALRASPRSFALRAAISVAVGSTSNPTRRLPLSRRRRCSPTRPLPVVSSAMCIELLGHVVVRSTERACASAASDAHAHSSVSSGEKNALNRNGGTKGRSLPASVRKEDRCWLFATGRPNRCGIATEGQVLTEARLLHFVFTVNASAAPLHEPSEIPC